MLAVGSGGGQDQATSFVQSTGLGVTTLWSPEADAAANYSVETLPHSILVDQAGNIIGQWPGLPEEAFALARRIS